mmetsp:Transcript_39228/g.89897  ORF Transcript_39228/g.89897 Transcript_39228/m.89897 type:complete len:221 (-) Transcript_39228:151-813(-)
MSISLFWFPLAAVVRRMASLQYIGAELGVGFACFPKRRGIFGSGRGRIHYNFNANCRLCLHVLSIQAFDRNHPQCLKLLDFQAETVFALSVRQCRELSNLCHIQRCCGAARIEHHKRHPYLRSLIGIALEEPRHTGNLLDCGNRHLLQRDDAVARLLRLFWQNQRCLAKRRVNKHIVVHDLHHQGSVDVCGVVHHLKSAVPHWKVRVLFCMRPNLGSLQS